MNTPYQLDLFERGDYCADNIKILTQDEAEGFQFALIARLCADYPLVSEQCIRRGIEACRRASVLPDYYINRYLKRDASIIKNEIVEQSYRDLMQELN